jgi:hypothetical protein
MKYSPFDALAPLLKCKKCLVRKADLKTGYCRDCEIKKLKRDQEREDK